MKPILYILLAALCAIPAHAQNGKSAKEGLSYEAMENRRYRLIFRTKQKFETLFVYELNSTDGVVHRLLSVHAPAMDPEGIYALDTVSVYGEMSYYVRLKKKGAPEGLQSNIVSIINQQEPEIEIEETDSSDQNLPGVGDNSADSVEEFGNYTRPPQYDREELRRNADKYSPDFLNKGMEMVADCIVSFDEKGRRGSTEVSATSSRLTFAAFHALDDTKITPPVRNGRYVKGHCRIAVTFRGK